MYLIHFIVVENGREKVLGSVTIDGCPLHWAAKKAGIETPGKYTIKKTKDSIKNLNWLDHIEEKDHVYYLKLKKGVEFSASSPSNIHQQVKPMSSNPSRQPVSTSNANLCSTPFNEDIEINTPNSSYIDFISGSPMCSNDEDSLQEDSPSAMVKEMPEENIEKLRQHLNAMRSIISPVIIRDFTLVGSSQDNEETYQPQPLIERNLANDSFDDNEMDCTDELDLPNTTFIEELDFEKRLEDELAHYQFKWEVDEICDKWNSLK